MKIEMLYDWSKVDPDELNHVDAVITDIIESDLLDLMDGSFADVESALSDHVSLKLYDKGLLKEDYVGPRIEYWVAKYC